MSTSNSPVATGVKYGIIISLVYCIMLFIRYSMFGSTPIQYSISAFVSFIVFIVLLVIEARARRKELGGYADVKQIFQTLFITIVIVEIVYALFTFIYLKYVDPHFWDTYIQSTREWMEQLGTPDDKTQEAIDKINNQKVMTVGKTFLGLGMWIILDSIVALLLSFIVKKNPPMFEQNTNEVIPENN